MSTAAEAEALRSGIESTHNATRDSREKQYISDKETLESAYHQDLKDIEQAKRDAMVTAGLNSDGSDPLGRQQV